MRPIYFLLYIKLLYWSGKFYINKWAVLPTKKTKCWSLLCCLSLDTDCYHADQIMPNELVNIRELIMTTQNASDEKQNMAFKSKFTTNYQFAPPQCP